SQSAVMRQSTRGWLAATLDGTMNAASVGGASRAESCFSVGRGPHHSGGRSFRESPLGTGWLIPNVIPCVSRRRINVTLAAIPAITQVPTAKAMVSLLSAGLLFL